MRVFKNKEFHKWASKIGLRDNTLNQAVKEISSGLYEAHLGNFVYKKRITISNRGKRGGLRTIVALKLNDKAIFMYGFAKNKLATINKKEEQALKELAKIYFNFTEYEINKALNANELVEITDD